MIVMLLTNEGKLNLETLLAIDEWLLERNFKELESAMNLFKVNPQNVWEQIQLNPFMSEQEFLEISKNA
jgi:hypothetical protein